MNKRVLYIGGDENFLSELEACVAPHDIQVFVSGSAFHVHMIWESLYAIVLDCEHLSDPTDAFCQLRKAHPHAAVLVVDGKRQLPLTNVSLARMHGAESFHSKPIRDWSQLLGALNGAFERMDRWHQLIERLEAGRTAAPIDSGQDNSPITTAAWQTDVRIG